MVERGPAHDIAASTPNVARMYDYYLGGKNDFAADRAAAEQVLAIVSLTDRRPDVRSEGARRSALPTWFLCGVGRKA